MQQQHHQHQEQIHDGPVKETCIPFIETLGLKLVASLEFLCDNEWKEGDDSDGDDDDVGQDPPGISPRKAKFRTELAKTKSVDVDEVSINLASLCTAASNSKISQESSNAERCCCSRCVAVESAPNLTKNEPLDADALSTSSEGSLYTNASLNSVQKTNNDKRKHFVDCEDDEVAGCRGASSDFDDSRKLLEEMDAACWGGDIYKLIDLMGYDNIIDTMDYVINGTDYVDGKADNLEYVCESSNKGDDMKNPTAKKTLNDFKRNLFQKNITHTVQVEEVVSYIPPSPADPMYQGRSKLL